jgi:hypothetical protein
VFEVLLRVVVVKQANLLIEVLKNVNIVHLDVIVFQERRVLA